MSTSGGSSSAASLLGATNYNPGAAVTYTIASATPAALDAANLAVAFTTPASGNVIVVLTALCDCAAANYMQWGLREAGADVAGSYVRVQAGGAQVMVAARIRLTGLAAGAHTLAWGAFTDGGVTAHVYTDVGGAGKMPKSLMEVWAA